MPTGGPLGGSSGGSGSDAPRLTNALTYFDKSEEYGTFAQTVMTVLGGMAVFTGALIAGIGQAGADVVVMLLDAFGLGGREIVLSLTRDPAAFLGESFVVGAAGFTDTAFSQLGPFLPWVGGASAIGFFALFAWYLDRQDSDVPGLGIDLPVIGNDEDGEPDDQEEGPFET